MPLDFAFVEPESTDTWLWFLQWVKRGAVGNKPNVCVFCDHHACLLNASNTLQGVISGVLSWPNLHSRWCMQNLGANFYKQFRSKRLMDLFKKLCKQNQRQKFDALWKELDSLTGRHMEEVLKKLVMPKEEEPEGLGPLPQEPHSVPRMKKG